MLFSNILTAYDGSEQAGKALATAIQFAREHPQTRLTVVHVFSYPAIVIGEAMLNAPPSIKKEMYEHAQELVNRVQKEISGLPNASVVLEQGFPAKTILEYAQEHACDLIVIGSRGLSGLRELVLGSVSHNVVHNAKIPVLVVK